MSDNLNESLKDHTVLITELINDEVVDFPELTCEELSQLKAKDILVMVNYGEGGFPKEESTLLGGIYNALKLDRAQTNFIDLGKKSITYRDAVNTMNTKYFILFGIEPKDIRLNINLRPYQIVKVGETQMIFSHPLADLNANQTYKKYLWNALKQMFNIQ